MASIPVMLLSADGGGEYLAVQCANPKLYLFRRAARLSVEVLQCQQAQDVAVSSADVKNWTKLLGADCDLREEHASIAHAMEGPYIGTSAVGLGSTKEKRLRACRLALALRAVLLDPGHRLAQECSPEEWGKEFSDLVKEARASIGRRAVRPPPFVNSSKYVQLAVREEDGVQRWLHMESGELERGEACPGGHAAMWVQADLGNGFFMLVNRWYRKEQGSRRGLLVESGRLAVGDVGEAPRGAMWEVLGPVEDEGVEAANRRFPDVRVLLQPHFAGDDACQLEAGLPPSACTAIASPSPPGSETVVACVEPAPLRRRPGRAVADFDGSEYGAEYISLTAGLPVARDVGMDDEQGWAFGCNAVGAEGWFPADFWEEDLREGASQEQRPPEERRPPEVCTMEEGRVALRGGGHRHGHECRLPRTEVVLVDDVYYTQETCRDTFRDGTRLEDMIRRLDEGRIDPLDPPFRPPQVYWVRAERKYVSLDNRRLYCYKAHQSNRGAAVRMPVRVVAESHDMRPVQKLGDGRYRPLSGGGQIIVERRA